LRKNSRWGASNYISGDEIVYRAELYNEDLRAELGLAENKEQR